MSSFNPSDIIDCEEIFIGLLKVKEGLKPFKFNNFAIFDKPTNLMVHPISKHTAYSLLDD